MIAIFHIHTLGELYSTLIDLKNQLPSQQEEEEEEPPSLNTRRSSSFTTNSNFSLLSFSSSDEQDAIYYNLISTYPDFIFESLLNLYTSNCCCCHYSHKKNLVESHQLGKLNKPFASVIFAYTAFHALVCHSEKYGIYSFLNSLAYDAYATAYELVEFDSMNPVTIETLIIMYQYLFLLGKEGEARNLFCLAWRQTELLLDENPTTWLLYRLVLWMTELDWSYSTMTPMIQYHHVKKSMQVVLKSNSLEDVALKYKMKGLHIILTSTVEQLNA